MIYVSNRNSKIIKKEFQKMMFLMNVLEKGWSIKKVEESYIFTKKHEGKKKSSI
jgi:hypothetical protein